MTVGPSSRLPGSSGCAEGAHTPVRQEERPWPSSVRIRASHLNWFGRNSAARPVAAPARRAWSSGLRRPAVREGDLEILELAEFDVVLMRQDPPFDLAYITATHILEHIHPATLVVNDPAAVRNAPEKLLVTHFPGVQPPTLVTRDMDAILDFRARYPDMILKPLYGGGGSGVARLKPDDSNLDAMLELHFAISRDPVICQAFLPAVTKGDKRILIVDGEPVGAINRVPADGHIRSNLRVGGVAEAVELTARDKELCGIIGPTLKAQGLMFVGVDVIGDYLTEINVTSPTGAQQLKRFTGIDATAIMWDRIEALRAAR